MKKNIFWPVILISLLIALTACAPTPETSLRENPDPTVQSDPPKVVPTDSAPPPTDTATPLAPKQNRQALPSGALTIVTLGDSLTQGDGDESGLNGFPTRLAQKIETSHPGTAAINLGRSGWASKDLLEGANSEAATLPEALKARPNIALVWIGSNDLWYLYEYGPDPMTAEAEQEDLANYTANIDSILRQLSETGANVFIALLDDQSLRPVVANPPNPSEPAFSAITPDDRARMSAHVQAMNEKIKTKAAEYGATAVDFFHTDIFTNPATLYSDGNHPNTAGYEQITKIWFSALEPLLR